MKKGISIAFCLCLMLSGWTALAQSGMDTATPKDLVATYDALADTILASDRAEEKLVLAILSTTYGHAMAAKGKAAAKIAAGEPARGELETLAAFVSQLGNEGDSAVAGVRKRLVEGGHHHNAKGEEDGLYDEGFVIVTKAAKRVFLESATEIGRMARNPSVEALDAVWGKVDAQYQELMKDYR